MLKTFPQNGVWAQVSDRDVFNPMQYGILLATSGIDLSDNRGRIRLGRRMVLNTSTDDLADITAVPVGFYLCGTSIFTLCGLSNTGYVLSNAGLVINPFTRVTAPYTGPTVFSGSGLNDATSSGTDTSGAAHVYTIIVDGTGGTNTFKWKVDSGSFTTGVSMTGSAQTLANGIKITFNATTGHTMGDQWVITTAVPPSNIDSTTSDGVFSNNSLYVSFLVGTQFYLQQKTGNLPFTIPISVAFDAVGYPHMLGTFIGRTYVTNNQSQIVSLDSSNNVATSGANTIILNNVNGDFTNVITKFFVSASRFWVCCVNTLGGIGYVYEWDGISTSYQQKHALSSPGALAGCDYHDIPYIVDVYGNLQYWNGATFKTIASFYRKNRKLLYNALSSVNNRFIHPNGMKIVNDKIRMVIDNRNYDATSSIEETITAGTYEFDPNHPENGIYNISIFGTAHAGDTIQDYGARRLAGAGGIAELNLPSTNASRNGSFLAGVGYYKDNTTVKYGIFYDDLNDTLQKAGSLITLKLDSDGRKDLTRYLEVLYKKLLNTGDKIVMKYIYEDSDPVEAPITFTGANSFTVNNSDLDLTPYYTVGNAKSAEVEIVHGTGNGVCAHIVNAVLSAGVWTVTTDETFVATSGTARGAFKNWNWLGEIDQGDNEVSKRVKPDISRSWFMFKIWVKWTGKNEIERVLTDMETIQTTDSSM